MFLVNIYFLFISLCHKKLFAARKPMHMHIYGK